MQLKVGFLLAALPFWLRCLPPKKLMPMYWD